MIIIRTRRGRRNFLGAALAEAFLLSQKSVMQERYISRQCWIFKEMKLLSRKSSKWLKCS
jgi:hypothetical protein